MASKLFNQLGSIKIDDKVIATIACSAAMETYGIVGLAAKNTKEDIYELLGIEAMTKGVKIVSAEDSALVIEASVIMEYGTRIAVVAENLIGKIKYNVESMTGLKVRSVNLIVQGIRV